MPDQETSEHLADSPATGLLPDLGGVRVDPARMDHVVCQSDQELVVDARTDPAYVIEVSMVEL